MPRIRRVEIKNFRCVQELDWYPADGINCLLGPGDSGKTTVLDAIDLCLGARRNLQFTDNDFFMGRVETRVEIRITVGEISDALKNFDAYGLFLRGFRPSPAEVLPEPEADAEIVLTIQLTIDADLEPVWTLYSERAEAQAQVRLLSWADRLVLAPARLGAFADHHLSWRRGSVLHRVSAERASAPADLAKVARDARASFGEKLKGQVSETLATVKGVAAELGVDVGEVTAMLDADSVSMSGGTIALHDGNHVPLRELGLGSTRLLMAGLQRKTVDDRSILLVDEVEHGLEPHRIVRLVTTLGAKEEKPPLQAFLASHSPVVLRELSASQLYVLRRRSAKHEVRPVGDHADMQGAVRACAEAFLARSVIVCEGASEFGMLRGLDLHRVATGKPSMLALGVALADGRGETALRRANAFAALGYRTLLLRDDDKQPDAAELARFAACGGVEVKWRTGNALEDELFASVSDGAVRKLLETAVAIVGEQTVDDQIKTASKNAANLSSCRASITPGTRAFLGKAAKSKTAAWFKNVSTMEDLGREIIGPDLLTADPAFQATVDGLFAWTARDGSAA